MERDREEKEILDKLAKLELDKLVKKVRKTTKK